MASLLLGSLGSSLLGPLGGFIGSALGSAIDTYLFSPVQEGPRLDDLEVTRADPGLPIPLVYGADRTSGILIASSNIIETKEKKTVGGFLGIGGQRVIEYKYHIHMGILMSEGPVLGVARIWADGNLMRGPWYEMEVDAEENEENIGGIPYPDYYKDHLYQPSLIPWTLDRNEIATDDGNFYKSNAARSQMLQITSGEADNLLRDTKQVVYWKDTATGYYIPIHSGSHAYTGGKLEDPPEPQSIQSTLSVAEKFFDSSENYIYKIIDIYDAVGEVAEDPDYVIKLDGAVATLGITVEGNLGLSLSDNYFVVDYYSDGDNELIDGNDVGTHLGGTPVYNVHVDNGQRTNSVKFSVTDIPENTRYISVGMRAAMYFPIFVNIVCNASFVVVYRIREPSPKIRDWPDYWNIYDAINDWSKKAILQFDGARDVEVYHGKYEQEPSAILSQDRILGYEEGDVPAYVDRAYIAFDKLPLEDYGNRVPNITMEVVQFDDVRIGSMIADMCNRAGIDPENYDVSALPDDDVRNFVLGYSIGTKTNYRAALETALEAFRVDVAEIGDQLVFRPRNRYYDYTIDYMDLAAIEGNEKRPGDIIKLTFKDDLELPKILAVTFKDPEREYQNNEARFSRQSTIATSDTQMSIAAVMAPHRAKQYVRDRMRDIWLERQSGSITLPHKYVYLYPTDVCLINGSEYGADDITIKIKSRTRGANGLLEIEAVVQDSTIYVPEPGEADITSMDGSTFEGQSIPNYSIPATFLTMMDMPPLREDGDEDHNDNGYYVFMASDTNGWPGASVYQYDGVDGYDLLFNHDLTSVMGNTLIETLQDADAELIDWDSTVQVRLANPNDTLESITIAEMWEGYNMAIIGIEVVHFLNATLTNSELNIYTLTGFLRGRRGTDHDDTLSGHVAGERFILLEPGAPYNRLQDTPLTATQYYHAVTFGADASEIDGGTTVGAVSFDFASERIKPLAPTWITSTRDGSNNLTITWIRQDRYYQEVKAGSDSGNSETLEQYTIQILNGPTVVRTETVDDATEYVYSAADQTSDGLTPGETVDVSIHQNSSIYGAGYAAEATV